MKALNRIKIPIIILAVIASYAFALSSGNTTNAFKKTDLFFYSINQNHTPPIPVIPYTSPNTCQPGDSLALVALYHATNGAAWASTWDLTQPISTWHGVTLNDMGCVTELKLQNNQLSGTLPPEIGNLSQLNWLWLSDNQLIGSIPSEIGNLTNLEWWWLSNNQLSGSIPSEVDNLINLEWLWLADNQLTGSIPPLSNLGYLKWFWIADNQLNGCFDNSLIDFCSQLDPIFAINAYISNGNNFDEHWENFCSTQAGICMPINCGQIDSLALVDLYYATDGANWLNAWDLTQPIATWYGVTTNANGCVTELKLPDNQLAGNLPTSLSDLKYLTWLWVSGNQLSGCYPAELSSLCSQLAPVYNDNTYISEGNNFEVTWEDFCNNGNGICYICQPTDSLALVALYNATSGANWSNPWNLNQPINTWIGVTTSEDGCVTELKLSNGQLIGNLAPEIGNLSSLTTFNLGSNQLNGSIPPQIGNLKELTFLNLGDNQLTGNIPIEITNLTNLTILGLETNQLTGNIPPEIGNLTELTWLWLSENQLTGNIPSELSNLNEVTFLWMENNQLTGNIPPEIGNMESLIWLWLSENQLSGCYDIALAGLCSQLDPTYNANTYISDNNNFYADWEMFCNNQEGFCGGPVWPGDFNNDGRAKHTDLLYWGLAYGNTGSSRPNASTDWIAQNAPEWQSNVSGVNSKHQDGDGNGLVDSLDIAVLINNYGKVHSFTFPNYLTNTLEYRLEALPSTADSATLALNYALHIEEFDAATVAAHGLAFEIDFTSLPLTHASADFSNSSLQPEQYINFYHTGSNTLRVVLTRTDRIDQVCNGSVALIQAMMPIADAPDDIFLIRLPNEEGLMQADGTRKVVRGMTLYDRYTTNNDLTLTASARQLECMSAGEATVHISGGTPPYDIQWNTGADTPQITGLTPGIYSVAVSDAAGASDTLFVEIDGLFIPIYDNFGNLVECNAYAQCATVSNFTDNLPVGTQAAAAAISTDGTVPAGSQVTLKAGNIIILQSNFEVQLNAEFSAEIEDCQ